MGIGIRFYIWDDNDDNKGFRRYPRKSFEKSYKGIPNKDLIEYARARIKYVTVFLEMESRKPIEIRHTDCGVLTVVVWSSGLFAVKKSRDLYSWELTGNQLNQLIEDIFNKET